MVGTSAVVEISLLCYISYFCVNKCKFLWLFMVKDKFLHTFCKIHVHTFLQCDYVDGVDFFFRAELLDHVIYRMGLLAVLASKCRKGKLNIDRNKQG